MRASELAATSASRRGAWSSGSAAIVQAMPADMYATRPSFVASRFSGRSLFVWMVTSGQSWK